MSYQLICARDLFKNRAELLHVTQVAPGLWRFLNKSITSRLSMHVQVKKRKFLKALINKW